jgi:AraC family transcriptional regulator, L-rhamnose operon regulatory protein RhaS
MHKKISNTDTIESYYPVTLLPELPGLGWRTFSQGTPGGPRPSGGKAYEICFVDKGSVEWWFDDKLSEAGSKSLFVNKPGEWHGGESGLIQPCEMYWVQFYFPPQGRLPGLAKETQLELKRAFETMTFEAMQHRSFPASAHIKIFFEQLMNEQRQPQTYSLEVARAAFHQILITTVRDHAKKDALRHSEGIAKALAWMNNHIEHEFYSEAVAKIAGMSVGHFYKLFVQEVGLTPADYHMRQRIFLAKQKLRGSDRSITDIALGLGLSSSQYFATVFKKVVGVTPKEYREIRKSRV